MRRFICFGILALCLTACQIPYQADGWLQQGGYSERSLGQDRWQVTFRGDRNTEMERAMDFSLLRAAQLCAGSPFVVVHGSEYLFDEFEEEEVEQVYDEDGEVEEEYVKTVVVRTPRVVRDIECTSESSPGAEQFSTRYLANAIAQKQGL